MVFAVKGCFQKVFVPQSLLPINKSCDSVQIPLYKNIKTEDYAEIMDSVVTLGKELFIIIEPYLWIYLIPLI